VVIHCTLPPLSLHAATNPSEIRRKKVVANPFKTTPEGKLLIAEEGENLEQGL